VPEAIGMTTDAWVRDRIGGYVRLGLDERREAVKELTDPEGEFHLTQRQAAEVLGVGQASVSRALRDDPDESVEGEALGADADALDPDESRGPIIEPPAEVGLADVGADPPYPDESEPDQPTMGEILGGEPLVFDDSGLHEEIAAHKRQQRAATLLIEMLRFAENLPPGVMTEGIRPEHLPVIAGELGVVVEWLGHARRLAHDPRAQIRRVPS
jgi:hypothetical protein